MNVDSFKRICNQERFTTMEGMGIPSLIIAGYLLLAGLGLWGFTKRADASAFAPSAAPGTPTLTCRCELGSSLGSATERVQRPPVVQEL